MAVLLLGEVIEGALATDQVSKALAAVKDLGEVHVLIAGQGGDAAATEAATLDGVSKVLFADNPVFCHNLAEPTAALIVEIAGPYSHIAAASTAFSKSVLPRVAALLDVMVISEVVAVKDADTFDRPIYAGNAIQTVKSGDATKVMTIRTATFSAVGAGNAAPVETLASNADGGLSAWVEDKVASSDRPELTSAGIVVSGGAALDRRKTSPSSRNWRTSWARRWAHRARQSIRVMRRTTGRLARPARWWRPTCTSRSAFPARSSIWQA